MSISEMGLRIKQKRLEAGLTMEGLAQKLNVGNSAVNKWEKGYVTNIKRDTIEEMAKIFNCNPVWLMGYDFPVEEHITVELGTDAEINKRYEKATELYEKYAKATPEVQAAVELLLKSAQPKK